VFGGHDIAQAAAILRLPVSAVAHQLGLMLSDTPNHMRRPAVQR